jgi:hypothetical protein
MSLAYCYELIVSAKNVGGPAARVAAMAHYVPSFW